MARRKFGADPSHGWPDFGLKGAREWSMAGTCIARCRRWPGSFSCCLVAGTHLSLMSRWGAAKADPEVLLTRQLRGTLTGLEGRMTRAAAAARMVHLPVDPTTTTTTESRRRG